MYNYVQQRPLYVQLRTTEATMYNYVQQLQYMAHAVNSMRLPKSGVVEVNIHVLELLWNRVCGIYHKK